MKKVFVILALCMVSGCFGGPEIEGERLEEINDAWLKMYTADRRAVVAEAAEFDKLTDEQKKEWRKAGKPTLLPLSGRILAATMDFHKAVGMEAEAAK